MSSKCCILYGRLVVLEYVLVLVLEVLYSHYKSALCLLLHVHSKNCLKCWNFPSEISYRNISLYSNFAFKDEDRNFVCLQDSPFPFKWGSLFIQNFLSIVLLQAMTTCGIKPSCWWFYMFFIQQLFPTLYIDPLWRHQKSVHSTVYSINSMKSNYLSNIITWQNILQNHFLLHKLRLFSNLRVSNVMWKQNFALSIATTTYW